MPTANNPWRKRPVPNRYDYRPGPSPTGSANTRAAEDVASNPPPKPPTVNTPKTEDNSSDYVPATPKDPKDPKKTPI